MIVRSINRLSCVGFLFGTLQSTSAATATTIISVSMKRGCAMKWLRWIVAAAALTVAPPVHAATTDPLLTIYGVSGVADSGGGPGVGIATVFHCTNRSAVTESVRFVLRNFNSVVVANTSFDVPTLQTLTASTHFTALFQNATLSPTVSLNGFASIHATSVNVFCSTLLLDASVTVPSGVQLPMIRFNPIPNSQE